MDWNYILTSVVISIIISTTTFIFGLKAGKNQSDRPFLKELYKKLYSHFLKLFTAIDSDRPPKWADYKKVNIQNGYRYIPLIEELTNEGELVELRENYSRKLLELERDILILSRKQYSSYKDIENHIISFLTGKIGEQLIKEQYAYTTSKNTSGKSYISVNYSVFYSKSHFNEVLNRLFTDNNLSLQLLYYTDGNKVHPINLYVDSSGDNHKVIDLFQSIYNEIAPLEYVQEVKNEKSDILKSKDKVLKKLSRKTKNPHSFFQTVFGAIIDIFIG